MKRIIKNLLVTILGWQVKRLRSKRKFKIIAVVGSIGKTSTKFAIAKLLSTKYNVRFQKGNYNDILTVPLVFFGLNQPNILNPFAWLIAVIKIEIALKNSYPYDYVIVELGTDGPDQINKFSNYIHCDIAVLTAITYEHMEFFESIDDVAIEELSIAQFTDSLVINRDLCNNRYLNKGNNFIKFGKDNDVDYSIDDLKFDKNIVTFKLQKNNSNWIKGNLEALSMSEVYSATAASIIADVSGLTENEIESGIKNIKAVNGRMLQLNGIMNSIIIDETYNSSPEAVITALDSLYRIYAKHKIALLGNMNELGKFSEDAHIQVGKYCDPNQLDLVVTIGKDANKYTAKYAALNKCRTISFDNPILAGKFIKNELQEGSIVLAKGSQNGVYAEEAIKQILKDKNDINLLVRQSESWMRLKSKLLNKSI